MTAAALALVLFGTVFVLYTYLGYPLVLRLVPRYAESPSGDPEPWPTVSITLPAYNEEAQIRETLETLLEVDYPPDRLQILVVSDGSTDRTDGIVREYGDRGVELLRVEQRGGKSAAENTARHHLRGEIVLNTDASVRILPGAVKELVRRFLDPEVGVASGRDVSVVRGEDHRNVGESGYVGYEMWIRDLETRAGGIVGSSGCLYAIRDHLHDVEVPPHLSRDFMSALTARERGFKAVSVPSAVCLVPRTPSLRREFRRKVRTMVRGIQTLIYKRHLLNPVSYGAFAWRLFSHKVCRWAAPWAAAAGGVGLVLLAAGTPWGRWLLAPVLVVGVLAGLGWLWPDGRATPKVLSVPAYLVAGNVAACLATVRALRGYDASVWEPTRRDARGPARA